MPAKLQLSLITAIWATTVVVGFALLINHEEQPAAQAAAPLVWPSASQLPRSEKKATLIMFAHPFCPCTRASINELSKLVTRCRNKLNVEVVFLQPPGVTVDWEKSPSWQLARAIPGVTVRHDDQGGESNLFGARTSGEVVLYNPDGELIFHGGITGGRGHEGDNVGLDAVQSLLLHNHANVSGTPTFGCSLSNSVQHLN